MKVRQFGTSLIEVLVAALILGVGMIGMGGLMGLSMKIADGSFMRIQAESMAREMLDRLRANRGSVANPPPTSAIGGAYNAITLCKVSVSGCTSAPTGTTIANIDIRDWQANLNALNLPDWRAGIVNRTGDVFTVFVQWDDTRTKGKRLGQAASRVSCVDNTTSIADSIEQVCVTTQL